jgi:hypothetical protein
MRRFRVLGLLLCLPLLGCPRPGQGRKAEKGYATCEPVIAALERYHQEKGAWPDSLEALVPDYLAGVPALGGYPLKYQRAGEGYELQFSYTGPGVNRCTYTPESKWRCSGYF